MRRRRQSSKPLRYAWGAGFLIGYGALLYIVHEWFVAIGRSDLVDGQRPAYIGLSALVYWPLAYLVWWLCFPADPRGLPWSEPEAPLTAGHPAPLNEVDAQSLAETIQSETGFPVRVRQHGTSFAVDVLAPATTYRLWSAQEWDEELRQRHAKR